MWSSEQLLLFVLRVQVCLAPFADGLQVLSFPLGRSWTPERLRSSLRGASLEIRCGVSGVAFMQGLVWAGAFRARPLRNGSGRRVRVPFFLKQ